MGTEGIAIQAHRLTRRFGDLVAVKGIDLEIKEGELFSLLGPNGAGKTTTINMLCCLLKPSGGNAAVLGHDIVAGSYRVKSIIGVSPQETVLSERLSCWENLEVMGRIHGLDSRTLARRSRQLLETVGLLNRAKDQVGKFSGGMKRRLSLALALVHDPPVIFLDEPSLGLDPQARRAIWDYVHSLKGKKTILLTTHYMEEAEALSDRLGIIDEGKMVALGTLEELRKLPGGTMRTVTVGPSLEDVFLHLTGKELRE